MELFKLQAQRALHANPRSEEYIFVNENWDLFWSLWLKSRGLKVAK